MRIVGTALNDTLFGTDGLDELIGMAGDDLMFGGEGSDWFVGASARFGEPPEFGAGADTMHGGGGDDYFTIDPRQGDVVAEQAGEGWDFVQSMADYTLPANVEELNLIFDARVGVGNGLANRMCGSGGRDTLSGLAGDDTILGGAGGDVLFGDWGDDSLEGGAGTDTLDGGDGFDTAHYPDNLSSGSDVLVDLKAGTASFPKKKWGVETLISIEGVEVDGNTRDTLIGSSADNLLAGGNMRDWLEGGGGADRLFGEWGRDFFVYRSVADSTPESRDLIAWFDRTGVADGDRFDFRAIDADETVAGNQSFTLGWGGAGHLWAIDYGDFSLVRANVDADVHVELEILVRDGAKMAAAFSEEDFLL